MLYEIKKWKKAFSIVNFAQTYSLDLHENNKKIPPHTKYKRKIIDRRVGAHLASYSHRQSIEQQLGYSCPVRWENEELYVEIPDLDMSFQQIGNEWLNSHTSLGLTPSQWLHKVKDSYEGKAFPSPSLTTLKLNPGWKKLIAAEEYFNVWCLNLHFPKYLDKRYNGLGNYWECVKHVKHLIDFAQMTIKPVIITEAGVGPTHHITKPDLKYHFIVCDQIFGDRMLAWLAYNSDTAMRMNALLAFSKR